MRFLEDSLPKSLVVLGTFNRFSYHNNKREMGQRSRVDGGPSTHARSPAKTPQITEASNSPQLLSNENRKKLSRKREEEGRRKGGGGGKSGCEVAA